MKVFSDSLATPGANRLTLGDAVLRIVIGVLKFQVLAALFNTLAPTALLQDFHRHTMVDLVVSSVAYYGYLYCNFSGYTDVVIGMAGVLGITLEENFAQPYFARNIQEFWQRWHITLARYMRDMVYFPLVKTLTKRFGRRRYNAVVVLAIFVTFTLTGLWHGFALNFLYYGLLHAAGLICHFLYSTALKARLGPRITAYNANPYIRIAATALTFAYLCFTFYFFANKANQLGLIMQAFS
jgi:D-alanyl-lipoteichoic acid acyltransferase DltB (MBOAT superfamily)